MTFFVYYLLINYQISQTYKSSHLILKDNQLLKIYFMSTNLFFTFIYKLIVCAYSLIIRIHNIFEWVNREVTLKYQYMSNSSEKFINFIESLQKKPQKVILAITIPDSSFQIAQKSNNSEGRQLMVHKKNQSIINCIMEAIQIIDSGKINHICVSVCAQNSSQTQKIIRYLKDSLIKKPWNREQIEIIDWNKHFSQLKSRKMSIQHDRKNVPLIVSMNKFNGISLTPFQYLINAQIAFCQLLPYNSYEIEYPVIQNISKKRNTKILTLQLQKCFSQYSQSIQRHGK